MQKVLVVFLIAALFVGCQTMPVQPTDKDNFQRVLDTALTNLVVAEVAYSLWETYQTAQGVPPEELAAQREVWETRIAALRLALETLLEGVE